jgi:hypothetical protein
MSYSIEIKKGKRLRENFKNEIKKMDKNPLAPNKLTDFYKINQPNLL